MSEKEILLVDDDEINANMLAKRIEKRGLKVEVVNCGRDALKYLETKKPLVILLDIMMPDVSGLQVLEEIRKKMSELEVAIIMVTAMNEVEDIVHALKIGANDYLQKPINIDIAIARINTQIKALASHGIELEKKETDALKTMIATFNHEINNPLTVAFGYLWKLKKENKADYIEQVEKSLNRIVDIVKKIEQLTSTSRVSDKYAQEEKVYKL